MFISFLPRPMFPLTVDAAVTICGYERRASAILRRAKVLAKERISFGYDSNHGLSFDENRDAFAKAGYQYIQADDNAFKNVCTDALGNTLTKPGASVLIDISCMTRLRLAQLVEILAAAQDCSVHFWYALARFQPPRGEETVHQFVEPVSEFFAGWSGDTDRSSAVLAGLGYERMRAIGILEHLDASDAWLFFPRSPILRYDREVQIANSILLEDADPSRILDYPVDDPYALCQTLFALAGSVRQTHRCAIVPLGPKPFALASILAGVAYRDVSVWRISAGAYAAPLEKSESKVLISLSVRFSARSELRSKA